MVALEAGVLPVQANDWRIKNKGGLEHKQACGSLWRHLAQRRPAHGPHWMPTLSSLRHSRPALTMPTEVRAEQTSAKSRAVPRLRRPGLLPPGLPLAGDST